MAYPTVLGTRHSHVSAAASDITVLLPDASNVAGYLILAFVGSFSTTAHSWPAGWTSLDAGTDDGTARIYGSVRYHAVTGAEGWDGVDDSISVSGGSGDWVASVITVSAWLDTQMPELAVSNLGMDPPALTPSWGSAANLWIACVLAHSLYSTIEVIDVYPTGYVDNQHSDYSFNDNSAVSHAFGTKNATAASDDPSGFTPAHGDSRTVTVAVAPPPIVFHAVAPGADVTTTGWTDTPLFSKVDDDPASPDGTVISATAA